MPPLAFPAKWRPRKERSNSMLYWCLVTIAFEWSCRVRNLLQPIRSTAWIWVVTRQQYGISTLVPETRHFEGKPVVATRNVGCLLRLKHILKAIVTKLNASLAIRQWADLFEANIWAKKIIQNYCQPCIGFCFNSHFMWHLAIVSPTLEIIRQERTSRFYLRVEWTSAFKGFY